MTKDRRILGICWVAYEKERLIDYLSKKGVLPSYSFPLHTVELLLPKEARATEHLRLEKDLSQAIREYAPGQKL